MNLKTINIVFKRLRVGTQSVPSIILFFKDCLGRIGLRLVFSSIVASFPSAL